MFGESEVNDCNLGVPIDEDVLELQIAMDKVGDLMKIDHGVHELGNDRTGWSFSLQKEVLSHKQHRGMDSQSQSIIIHPIVKSII
jgi:hypothetical protein